jgi:ribulose-phosphate 3-epimerase
MNTESRVNHAAREYFTSVARILSFRYPDRVLGLAPSILGADLANLGGDLRRMLRAKCYWAHLDVMDGHFVPNITFGPALVKSIRGVSSRLFLDAHLMVEEPLRFLEAFVEAGANLITVHAEAVENLAEAVAAIRKTGVRPGVSIRPRTPIRVIEPVLGELDVVLVMTVEPGFGGQGLLPNTLSKVRQLAQVREKTRARFLIQVDGGINVKTAGLAAAAGANILVAGTAVFGTRNIAQNIAALAEAALKMGV